MTDKKIIINFIKRNYVVQLSEHFKIYDKPENKTLSIDGFHSEIRVILGDFGGGVNSTYNVVNDWLNNEKAKLVKDLDDFVKKQNTNNGFVKISELVLKKFSDSDKYNKAFVLEYLSDYYNNTVLLPKLEKHIEYLKMVDSDRLTYDKTIADFEKKLEFEGFKQREFANNYLLNWYKDTIIDEKINDLLSQLVVTLGPRNWKVTWIGHGELTRPKIESVFGNQSPSIYEYIMKRYDVWYDSAVEKASDRLISSNYGGF
jgi:hypothetical protein